MSPELFRKLATLGLSHDQMAGVLEIMEEAAEKGREKVRARVQKWRAKQSVTLPNATERSVTTRDALDLENKQTNKEERKQDIAPVARGVELAEFRAELSFLDAERLDALCAIRRKKGAVFSGLAGRGVAKALRSCPDILAAADEMVVRNWTTVKPDWLESRSAQRSQAPPPVKGDPFAALANISRAKGWTDEPASLPGNSQDDQRFPAKREEHRGTVVDLRRGPSGDFGPSDLRDSPTVSSQRNP